MRLALRLGCATSSARTCAPIIDGKPLTTADNF